MKIYREVTIDMNPESNSYGQHLSEDSFDYNGPLALAADKWQTLMTWRGEDGATYTVEGKQIRGSGSSPSNSNFYEGNLFKNGKKVKTLSKSYWKSGGKKIQELIKDTKPVLFGHVNKNVADLGMGGSYTFNPVKIAKEYEDAYDSEVKGGDPSPYDTMEDHAKDHEWVENKLDGITTKEGFKDMGYDPANPLDNAGEWLLDLGDYNASDFANVSYDSIKDKIKKGSDANFSKKEKKVLELAQALKNTQGGATLDQALKFIEKRKPENIFEDLKKGVGDVDKLVKTQEEVLYGKKEDIEKDDEGNIISAGGTYQDLAIRKEQEETAKEAFDLALGEKKERKTELETTGGEYKDEIEKIVETQSQESSNIATQYGEAKESALKSLYSQGSGMFSTSYLDTLQGRHEEMQTSLGNIYTSAQSGIAGQKKSLSEEISILGEAIPIDEQTSATMGEGISSTQADITGLTSDLETFRKDESAKILNDAFTSWGNSFGQSLFT